MAPPRVKANFCVPLGSVAPSGSISWLTAMLTDCVIGVCACAASQGKQASASKIAVTCIRYAKRGRPPLASLLVRFDAKIPLTSALFQSACSAISFPLSPFSQAIRMPVEPAKPGLIPPDCYRFRSFPHPFVRAAPPTVAPIRRESLFLDMWPRQRFASVPMACRWVSH